jgi:alpha-tubulin suppressor-like RCC1 family protein
MGFGKLTDIHLPAEDVVNLNGRVLQITADGSQTCALTAGGSVQCWGNNRYGQLGDGTTQKQYEPVQVTGLTSGVGTIETGWNHTCAVNRGGELMCWGWNFYGQLGDGTTVNQSVPARVLFLTDGVKHIAVGWGHTCVVTELDMVKCWGLNGSGQLGDGTWTDSPVPLTVIGL